MYLFSTFQASLMLIPSQTRKRIRKVWRCCLLMLAIAQCSCVSFPLSACRWGCTLLRYELLEPNEEAYLRSLHLRLLVILLPLHCERLTVLPCLLWPCSIFVVLCTNKLTPQSWLVSHLQVLTFYDHFIYMYVINHFCKILYLQCGLPFHITPPLVLGNSISEQGARYSSH